MVVTLSGGDKAGRGGTRLTGRLCVCVSAR